MGARPGDIRNKHLTAGLAGAFAAAGTLAGAEAAIRPKSPGETKIVAVLETSARSNGIVHELQLRNIFAAKRDWRLVCVRAAQFFTPELLTDADLLITCRGGGTDTMNLFSGDGGVADSISPGAEFWTDRNVDAIIDTVTGRGMGLLALHNSIASGNRRFTDFLDVAPLEPHEFEPLWITRINREHPITRETGKFLIGHDLQHLALIKSPSTVTLFETTAVHEKRMGVSGWALERGGGRVCGLLPGHGEHAYRPPEYRNIVWRAAHWAMKRDIEPYPGAENTLYD